MGRSSTSMACTRESNSVGSFSRMRYESLLVPTKSLGRSSVGSTRPGTGKKMVCRVLVRTTADRVLRFESPSDAPPGSSSSTSKPACGNSKANRVGQQRLGEYTEMVCQAFHMASAFRQGVKEFFHLPSSASGSKISTTFATR